MHSNREKFNITWSPEPTLKKVFQELTREQLGPYGALGRLSSAYQRLIDHQGSLELHFKFPALLLFAGDHGVARHFPAEGRHHSAHYFLQFLEGQGPLFLYNRQSRYKIKLIDLGMNYSFEQNLNYWLNHGKKLLSVKIAPGTEDFLEYPALTTAQALDAFAIGKKLVEREKHFGSNLLALSGLGEGQSVSLFTLWTAISEGRGLDLTKSIADPVLAEAVAELVDRALRKHPKTMDPLTVLTLYGGFELLALTGALLKAAEAGISLLLDGPAAHLALYFAQFWNDGVAHYCISLTNWPVWMRDHVKEGALATVPVLNTYEPWPAGIAACNGLQELWNGRSLWNPDFL